MAWEITASKTLLVPDHITFQFKPESTRMLFIIPNCSETLSELQQVQVFKGEPGLHEVMDVSNSYCRVVI